MPTLTLRGACVCSLLAVGVTCRAGPLTPVAPEKPDPADVGQYEEVLAELDSAGSPLGGDELRELVADASGPEGGVVIWRQTIQEGCLPPGSLKVDYDREGLVSKVRSSRDGCRREPWRGSISWTGGRSGFWAGDVALVQGFGMLAGRPGRTASPAADRTLGGSAEGLRHWPYAPSGSALRGVGLHLAGSRLALDALAGGRAGPRPVPAEPCRLVRLSYGRAGGRSFMSLLGLWSGQEHGVSLAVHKRTGMIAVDCEAVMGLHTVTGPGAKSFMGRLKLNTFSLLSVEGAAAWCDGGSPSSLGVRPSVLRGWNGRGWALRTVAHPVRGATLKCLLAGAEDAELLSTNRSRRQILEVIAGFVPAPRWRGSLRWRCQRSGEDTYSPRYPWQPAVAGGWTVVTTTAAVLAWTAGTSKVQTSVRTRDTVDDGAGATRYLWSVSGRYLTGSRWWLRGSWGSAWGGKTDLVSALSPLRGYVIPRHWSRWRQEWMAGVGREFGFWRLQAGIAVRDPAPDALVQTMTLQGWLEMSVRW